MVNEATTSANAIIAKALEDAGVPLREISIPSETEAGELGQGRANLDGSSKGEVKGEIPEVEETTELEPKAPAEAESDETKGLAGLSKADIEAAINQASSKFQGIMDRKINQIQLQVQQTAEALNQFFQSQEDTNLSGLPENEQVLKRLDRIEKGGQQARIQIQQPIERQSTQFYQQLVNFVDAVGLKVDDKRIDWAPGVDDPQTGLNRFLASIKTALVEDQTKVIQDLKGAGDKVLTNLRKKTGVDAVSTAGPSGEGLPDIDKMTPLQKLEHGYKTQEELSQAAK